MKIKPTINEICHVFNRGVEKRLIFMNDDDRDRFVYDLFVFNDNRMVINKGRDYDSLKEVGLPSEREKLVEIMAFALMPNHFHMMVKQITENGITEFMRKLGTGYANYFNNKYERVGPLFQGKYKAALVKNDRHFMYLPYYIHLNPLGIKIPKLRNNPSINAKQAIKFLNSYKWSSHLDYTGEENLTHIIDKEFLNSFWGSPAQYKKDVVEWLKSGNAEQISGIILEDPYE